MTVAAAAMVAALNVPKLAEAYSGGSPAAVEAVFDQALQAMYRSMSLRSAGLTELFERNSDASGACSKKRSALPGESAGAACSKGSAQEAGR